MDIYAISLYSKFRTPEFSLSKGNVQAKSGHTLFI